MTTDTEIKKAVLEEIEQEGVHKREIENLCWAGFHIEEIIDMTISKTRAECETRILKAIETMKAEERECLKTDQYTEQIDDHYSRLEVLEMLKRKISEADKR